MRADAFLARIEKVAGHPPLAEGNLAALEYGADRDGELALAAVAVEQTGTPRLALQQRHVIVGRSAVRANGTIGPTHRFKRFACRDLVCEDGVLCVGFGHDWLQ